MRFLISVLFLMFVTGCTTTTYSLETHTVITEKPKTIYVRVPAKKIYIKHKERCVPKSLDVLSLADVRVDKGKYAKTRDVLGFIDDLEEKNKLLVSVVEDNLNSEIICYEM